jgi:hypothetical protein
MVQGMAAAFYVAMIVARLVVLTVVRAPSRSD